MQLVMQMTAKARPRTTFYNKLSPETIWDPLMEIRGDGAAWTCVDMCWPGNKNSNIHQYNVMWAMIGTLEGLISNFIFERKCIFPTPDSCILLTCGPRHITLFDVFRHWPLMVDRKIERYINFLTAPFMISLQNTRVLLMSASFHPTLLTRRVILNRVCGGEFK